MIEEKCTVKRSLRLVLPLFRDDEHIMMNSFCNRLENEVARYVASDAFPKGSLYTVKYDYSRAKEETLVVYLSVRDTSGRKKSKKLITRWRYGMLCKMSEEIN